MTLQNYSFLQPSHPLCWWHSSISRYFFSYIPKCPLFNATSISLHRGLSLNISPSTTKKYIYDHFMQISLFFSPLILIAFNLNVSIYLKLKYLGVIIQSVHSKACQTIGVIYHSFYQHASPQTLFIFCCSLVIPYFTYCSCVWDPPASSTFSEIFEKTQHCFKKMLL